MINWIRRHLLYSAVLFAFVAKGKDPVMVSDFSLKSTDGRMVSTSAYSAAKGFIIVFTCNHCPFAKLYPSRFNALNSKYGPLGVPLLAINSMDSVLYEEEVFLKMQRKAKNEHFNFPYLQDASQEVGKVFGADHTPEAFVIWRESESWVVKYQGAIDDNGEHPDKAVSYVSKAVDELLSGQPVTTPETPSFGCRIFYRETAK